VADPLNDLGYRVTVSDAGTLPLRIDGDVAPAPDAPPVRAVLRTASAQVKSCILLSGLFRATPTEVIEPAVSRDHTERIFRAFGLRCESSPHYLDPIGHSSSETAPWVRFAPGARLDWRVIEVPGDISSAAFLLVAGALTGEGVTIEGVGTNPTRREVLDVLERMGASVAQRRRRTLSSGEPVADLHVKPAPLRATRIAGAEIPLLIDEIPVLCVLGAAAAGRFEVRDAKELRVKESDRIETTAELLRSLGVGGIEVFDDGLAFDGLGAATWGDFAIDSHGDHRIALAAAVAGLAGRGEANIGNAGAIAVSYPQFEDTLRALGAAPRLVATAGTQA
jgi:3-phosphoshikimate 1-carboxyvinyltransferase